MQGGSCGKLPEYPYAKPAKWNEVKKGMATTAVAYTSGDVVKSPSRPKTSRRM